MYVTEPQAQPTHYTAPILEGSFSKHTLLEDLRISPLTFTAIRHLVSEATGKREYITLEDVSRVDERAFRELLKRPALLLKEKHIQEIRDALALAGLQMINQKSKILTPQSTIYQVDLSWRLEAVLQRIAPGVVVLQELADSLTMAKVKEARNSSTRIANELQRILQRAGLEMEQW